MNVLYWLDLAIKTLSGFVDIIPGKIDDFALAALKFLRNDETFLTWLENAEPAPEGAFSAPPAAVTAALNRWKAETQPVLGDGSYMELLGYLMQVIQWIQKKRGQPAPAT